MTLNELVEFHKCQAWVESRLAEARYFILRRHAQCPEEHYES